MRISAGLVLVLVTAFTAPAFGESFVGTWTATAEAPTGKVSETVIVVKTADGYSINATLVGAESAPQAGPGTDIVIDGNNFSYKRSMGDLVITYSGVVSGNTFTGQVQIGEFKVPYNGVRASDGK
jgi:hypothetical protein